MDPFLIWLYFALLVAAGVAGAGLHGPRRAPIATMVAFGLAALPSLLPCTAARPSSQRPSPPSSMRRVDDAQ
ncbi:hypothetical protein [Dactylosporangium darangshiense]|uniref:Uncharacterized protein n=1 Tax=Dactylosporangium darangshiense TaxID=579108 RepID=A0ABP8DPS9_9ACTN